MKPIARSCQQSLATICPSPNYLRRHLRLLLVMSLLPTTLWQLSALSHGAS